MARLAARREQSSRRELPPPAEQPIVHLDWRAPIHNLHQGKPCVLCGTTAHLRSHGNEAVHKTCAEAWNAQHPGEARFVSDVTRRRKRDEDGI
jgi:hypothetical protein